MVPRGGNHPPPPPPLERTPLADAPPPPVPRGMRVLVTVTLESGSFSSATWPAPELERGVLGQDPVDQN